MYYFGLYTHSLHFKWLFADYIKSIYEDYALLLLLIYGKKFKLKAIQLSKILISRYIFVWAFNIGIEIVT